MYGQQLCWHLVTYWPICITLRRALIKQLPYKSYLILLIISQHRVHIFLFIFLSFLALCQVSILLLSYSLECTTSILFLTFTVNVNHMFINYCVSDKHFLHDQNFAYLSVSLSAIKCTKHCCWYSGCSIQCDMTEHCERGVWFGGLKQSINMMWKSAW